MIELEYERNLEDFEEFDHTFVGLVREPVPVDRGGGIRLSGFLIRTNID